MLFLERTISFVSFSYTEFQPENSWNLFSAIPFYSTLPWFFLSRITKKVRRDKREILWRINGGRACQIGEYLFTPLIFTCQDWVWLVWNLSTYKDEPIRIYSFWLNESLPAWPRSGLNFLRITSICDKYSILYSNF